MCYGRLENATAAVLVCCKSAGSRCATSAPRTVVWRIVRRLAHARAALLGAELDRDFIDSYVIIYTIRFTKGLIATSFPQAPMPQHGLQVLVLILEDLYVGAACHPQPSRCCVRAWCMLRICMDACVYV